MASSFIAIDRPSAASRKLQMRAWSAAVRAPPAASAAAGRARSRSSASSRGGRSVRTIAVELDAQQRGRIALDEGAPQRLEPHGSACVIEDESVHHLDRGRLVPKNRRRRAERVEQVVELDRQHRLRLRQRHQVELAPTTTPSVPSEPTMIFARLNGCERIDERVEVVAADAAQHLGKAALDLVAACRSASSADRSVAVRLRASSLRGCLRQRARRRAGRNAATLPSDSTTSLLEHVIDGLAVDHRSRAARVVRHHAADRGAAGGRDVGREAQAVRPERAFSSSSTMPGSTRAQRSATFTSSTRLKYFDVSSDQAGADRLAGLRRAAAARRERTCRAAPADLDRRARRLRASAARRRRAARSGRRWRRSNRAREITRSKRTSPSMVASRARCRPSDTVPNISTPDCHEAPGHREKSFRSRSRCVSAT